jgi:hypothetical protein
MKPEKQITILGGNTSLEQWAGQKEHHLQCQRV